MPEVKHRAPRKMGRIRRFFARRQMYAFIRTHFAPIVEHEFPGRPWFFVPVPDAELASLAANNGTHPNAVTTGVAIDLDGEHVVQFAISHVPGLDNVEHFTATSTEMLRNIHNNYLEHITADAGFGDG